MTHRFTRRRFLTISAAAMTVGSQAPAASTIAEATWRGTALGAGASMRLLGLSNADAAPILAEVEGELARLEDIFSLYRAGSEISRLNETGALDAPSPDLLEVLSLSDRLNRATEGAFDPTVQPLFRLYAKSAAAGREPDTSELTRAMAKVGWHNIAFDAARVTLGNQAAITLNGIAQGYITDRIAALLTRHGLRDILIDMGEIAARGRRPDGSDWRVAISQPDGTILRRLHLSDRAMATSAPLGTVLDANGKTGHIFNARHGDTAKDFALITLSAPSAALADGLSTAFCAMPMKSQQNALDVFADVRLEARVKYTT